MLRNLLQSTFVVSTTVLTALVLACNPDTGGDDSSGGGSSSGGDATPVDDLPTDVPAPGADIRVIEMPEQIIPATSETQRCYFLEPEAADIYANALTSFQGKFGHHLVLFRTLAPEPPGTVRDCTSIADMVNLIPVISSVNFGLEEFPPNTALRVPAGTQMVVQQHYVNTGDSPIRVKDILHLRTMDKADVSTLAGFYGLSNVDFQLVPDDSIEQTVEFTCSAPRDMNLLLMGPHMHEWGLRMFTEITHTADGAKEEVQRVDPWQAAYRDEPPVTEWGIDAPRVLKQGDTIHTTCVFKNTAGKVLKFPSEMCATYGYYFPAPEGSDVWTCDGT